MKDGKFAVRRWVNINFNDIRAIVESGLNRGQGVFQIVVSWRKNPCGCTGIIFDASHIKVLMHAPMR